MKVTFHWNPYRYLPYEKVLAGRELAALLCRPPTETVNGLSVDASDGWEEAARRTTYFSEAVAADGRRVIPVQTELEASANGRQPHALPGLEFAPAVRRQSTRYSAHGLHEYRGKFNPQVVRVVGNILSIPPGAWILDPFCGSGTSLLEALHAGWNAIGADLNPLAVQIARAKIAMMRIPLPELWEAAETLKARLKERLGDSAFHEAFSKRQMEVIGGAAWEERLPSIRYLRAWFAPSVLVQLSVILEEIAGLANADVRLVFQVLLSDIVREVSLQDPGDLRIRRRKNPASNAPAVPLYLNTVAARLDCVAKARECLPETTTTQLAIVADARSLASVPSSYPSNDPGRRFDAVITSPPYATALPYVDTQRLSLVVLGLLSSEGVRTAERMLIGSREIGSRERMELERAVATNASGMPEECVALCREMGQAIEASSDGFRRRNVPALLYKYLADMRMAFHQVRLLLQDGAALALVVGRNHTVLGGKAFTIDTPRLLARVAQMSGFVLEEMLELETYARFDVHQANSIRSEVLVILEAGKDQ